jgi:hypothetical protein
MIQKLFTPANQLRIEGAGQFALAVWAYHQIDGNWIGFVVLFLVPDLSWLGYLGGNQVGAAVYNVVHNNLLPLALAALGFLDGDPLAIALALIWFAHIGADRLLGFGLKYSTGFKDTHLGTLTGSGNRKWPQKSQTPKT